MVDRGLAPDPEDATRLVEEGRVFVDGAPALNPDRLISPPQNISISPEKRYPSRAGEKLASALDRLELDVSQFRCFDAGAAHGGFTACLLERGAAQVVAADVSYGDLDWELRQDRRVKVFERVNLREGIPHAAGVDFDLVVADLSFISLTLVLDNLLGILASGGDLLVLVKPQFEAPRSDVGERGLVSDPDVWRAAVNKICVHLLSSGKAIAAVVAAEPKGAGGNREFFVHSVSEASEADADFHSQIDAAITEVT